ncbi:hypothetical protein PG984_013744 [Apiospora sp. TS-2023a]
MVAPRRKRIARPSREDVASREPNILEACTMKFGYPGISLSEISRPRLKRQAEVYAGGDPFFNERGDGPSAKRRKLESFPIGPPKDVCILRHRGNRRKVVPAEQQQKSADSSPGAAKGKRVTERKKSKRLITADESTTIGRFEVFAWHAEYPQNCSYLAAPKNKKNRNTIPKKVRQDAASRLIFGKGIADVGVGLGKSSTTTSPVSDLSRQFSGEGLIDGVLGTSQQTLPTKSVPIRLHQPALRQQPPDSPPRTPVDADGPLISTIIIPYDDTASIDTFELRTPSCDFNDEAKPPTPQPRSGKRAREEEEEDSEQRTSTPTPPSSPTSRKRTKKTPTPTPSPTVVTRAMKREMAARGVYLTHKALPY